jgi:chaperone modulatory protein CbpM
MNSAEENSLIGEIVDDHTLLTVEELCRLCAVDRTYIVELVEEGVLSVTQVDATEWRFAGATVHRARKALRLQRDLEINLPGVALALELLEQLERLSRQIHSERV